jgi:hypothetical protein
MAQLTFYQRGTGSSYYTVPTQAPSLPPEIWAKLRESAMQLMRARDQNAAAVLLRDHDFQIYKGENDWHDEFEVLYRKLTLDEYIVSAAPGWSERLEAQCTQIALTLAELGQPVRFIGAEYTPDHAPQPVSTPTPKLTSTAVQAALADAEQMVSQNRPVSAVDRAHTALHGYLKQICADANLTVQSTDPSLTESVKILIKLHPKFSNLGPQKDQIEKVFRGMSAICDALNPIRNHGSLAHANEALLEPAEAMLAINASRTLLHYVDQKLQ